MKNKCPACETNLSLFSGEEITCHNCGSQLTSKNSSLAYYVICAIAYLPVKFAIGASWTMGTLIQAIVVAIVLWGLFISLNLIFVNYKVKDKSESE